MRVQQGQMFQRALQGDFAMLIFGVTRNFEDAKERLENLNEIVRQSGRSSSPCITATGFCLNSRMCVVFLPCMCHSCC